MIGDTEGLDIRLEEFTEEDHDRKMAMLLDRRVVGLNRIAAEKIDDVIRAEVFRWWKKVKEFTF